MSNDKVKSQQNTIKEGNLYQRGKNQLVDYGRAHKYMYEVGDKTPSQLLNDLFPLVMSIWRR